MWYYHRLTMFFGSFHHFFCIVRFIYTLDCPIDCLRIMDIPKTIHEDKSFHSINFGFIKPILLLIFPLRLERIIGIMRIPASVFGRDTANEHIGWSLYSLL